MEEPLALDWKLLGADMSMEAAVSGSCYQRQL